MRGLHQHGLESPMHRKQEGRRKWPQAASGIAGLLPVCCMLQRCNLVPAAALDVGCRQAQLQKACHSSLALCSADFPCSQVNDAEVLVSCKLNCLLLKGAAWSWPAALALQSGLRPDLPAGALSAHGLLACAFGQLPAPAKSCFRHPYKGKAMLRSHDREITLGATLACKGSDVSARLM